MTLLSRSFRIGLRVGVLGGAAIAVVRAVQARQSQPSPSALPSALPAPPDRVPAWQGSSAPARITPAPAPTPTPDQPEAPTADAPVEIETAPVPRLTVVPTPQEATALEQGAKPKASGRTTKAARATGAAGAAGRPTGAARPKPAKGQLWVEPAGGVCPPSHPVKAKLSSRLFHLPGMFAYDRTKPDRCYQDERSAAADGLTRAKR